MKVSRSLLLILLIILSISGCSSGDDKAGKKVLDGDYSGPPGGAKPDAGAGDSLQPGDSPAPARKPGGM